MATLKMLAVGGPTGTLLREVEFDGNPYLVEEVGGLFAISDGKKTVTIARNYFVSLETGATPTT